MAEINNEEISQVLSSIIDAERKADEIVAASLVEVKKIAAEAASKVNVIKDNAETAVKSEMTMRGMSRILNAKSLRMSSKRRRRRCLSSARATGKRR